MENKVVKILDGISYKIQLSDRTYIDNDGYLVCEDAIFGRVGIQEYAKGELGIFGNPNEMVEVHRLPEYIFDEASLETLDGKPLTLGHPKIKVTIDNYKDFAKGFVQNIRHDEHNIYGDIRVTDKKVRDIIENKQMRELSLGYDMVLFQDDNDENVYYCKDIIYNHLALVKQGRAGNAMILDSKDNFEERGNDEVPDKEEKVVDETLVEKEETKEEINEKVIDEDKVEEKEQEEKQEKEIEEKEDKEEKVDDACKDACDNEEPKEEDDKKEIKDTKEIKDMTYVERALEIDKVQDAELRKALKDQLMQEMGVKVGDEKQETVKVEIGDNKVEDETSHEDKMQAYYDSFDPHLYGNDCNSKEYKDAIKENVLSRKLEDVYRQKKINNK